LTIEELQKRFFNGNCSTLKSKTDIRDYKLSYQTTEDVIIPDEFELETDIVKNQGQTGCCASFSLSYVIEHLKKLFTKVFTELAPCFIYSQKSDHTSSGMELREALKIATNIGVCRNELFPYIDDIPTIFDDLNKSDIDSLYTDAANYKAMKYAQLTDEKSIKLSLMHNGFIYAGIEWDDDNLYSSVDISENPYDYEIHIEKGTHSVGGHAITIIGWNSFGWKFLNSWSDSWANNGKAVLSYKYPVWEFWSVIGEAQEPTDANIIKDVVPVIKKPSDNHIYQLIAKFVNWIINLFKNK